MSVSVTYSAQRVQSDLLQFEESLLEMQLQGDVPVFRKQNVMIYERFGYEQGDSKNDNEQ